MMAIDPLHLGQAIHGTHKSQTDDFKQKESEQIGTNGFFHGLHRLKGRKIL